MVGLRGLAAKRGLPPGAVHDRGDVVYLDFRFQAGDILLFGRESAGVEPEVHAAADARLLIPMRPGLRSLNIAIAAAMAAGEALRQTGGMRMG